MLNLLFKLGLIPNGLICTRYSHPEAPIRLQSPVQIETDDGDWNDPGYTPFTVITWRLPFIDNDAWEAQTIRKWELDDSTERWSDRSRQRASFEELLFQELEARLADNQQTNRDMETALAHLRERTAHNRRSSRPVTREMMFRALSKVDAIAKGEE